MLEIQDSPVHGKGVFATTDIPSGTVIAECHVLLLLHDEPMPEQIATLEFPWDESYYALCISGVGSFFNHDKQASARVKHQDKVNQTQVFESTRDVKAGEEIMIYYNDAFQASIETEI